MEDKQRWRDEGLGKALADARDTSSMSSRYRSLHETTLNILAHVIQTGTTIDQTRMDHIYISFQEVLGLSLTSRNKKKAVEKGTCTPGPPQKEEEKVLLRPDPRAVQEKPQSPGQVHTGGHSVDGGPRPR
jgi:hypothetical protein